MILGIINVPLELKTTYLSDGVRMLIVAAGLLSIEQSRVAFSPAVSLRVVILPLNCGASENIRVQHKEGNEEHIRERQIVR